MSSAKWCPEIVLCNSSNEKERDRRVKTWVKKKGREGARPHPQMHKECVLFRKERLTRRQDFKLLLFLSWASGPVTFLNARSVFSRLCFSILGRGNAH